jgi:hypothetical protein
MTKKNTKKTKAVKYDKLSAKNKYEYLLQLQTESTWHHMGQRLEILPDDEVVHEISDDMEQVIGDVEAVESEWILDEDVRATISLIQWQGEED